MTPGIGSHFPYRMVLSRPGRMGTTGAAHSQVLGETQRKL